MGKENREICVNIKERNDERGDLCERPVYVCTRSDGLYCCAIIYIACPAAVHPLWFPLCPPFNSEHFHECKYDILGWAFDGRSACV